MIDKGIKAAGKSAEDAFDEFWQKESGRMAAMEEFRQALAKLTAPNKGEATPQKLIFIIDELDRCRPDYALTLLEIMKHFFAVPNVHFVLGTNLTALENSVKARYGQGIDAKQYLQKFVHLTMHFPKHWRGPIGGASVAYFENTVSRFKLPDTYEAKLQNLLERLATQHNISLRDVQRLLTSAALLPDSLGSLHEGYTTLICGALFLRVSNPKLYLKLRSGNFDFAKIERTLALHKPTDGDEFTSEAMSDWIRWWSAFHEGDPQNLADIPDAYKPNIKSAFGKGHSIQWETIEAQFATAFDTYTLPNQP